MPVLFVGHGSPMNAIEHNPITAKWELVGETLPKPQAIVVISAHWMTGGTHVTDTPKQKIIYDMYGFPDELYQYRYEADGDPVVAKLLTKYMHAYEAKLDSSWGLDHGTWSVLAHIAPKPDVPVLQISLDGNLSLGEQYEVFEALRPLRDKGVLFIGSGNIVHNLGALDFSKPALDFSLEFDDFSKNAIEGKNLAHLTEPSKFSAAFSMAVPTDEHYRPMLATMALLDKNETVDFFVTDLMMGSISMRSFISV